MYRIYLSPPSQNGTERDALLNCLDSNWLAPVGPDLDVFEEKLSELHQNKPVVALNSGTAAIHLALILCGVGKGDEVLVQTHTHNATVNPIIYQNATPVFVDSEMDTWNMCPEKLLETIEHRIKLGAKPKAIILVHLYGLAAKLDEIMAIANKYQIAVIEDAAEALGATYKEQPLGTFGDFGILSFNGNKIVTSGGGGALICENEMVKEKALFYATQAREQAPHFEHSEIGYNYRLSNVLAALGAAQLNDLQQRVARRREVFERYCTLFTALNESLGEECVTWTIEQTGVVSNRWLSAFLINPLKGVTRETWRLKLAEYGIESRPLWKPMHLQPVFGKYSLLNNGVANDVFDRGICLPSGFDLTNDEQNEIASIVHSLYF